jgi:1,4-alpha-glucan branching enzyme
MTTGYLALVLHAHLPYVRHIEYEDALEENWLYEAITETYVPLLLMMDSLTADGVDFRLTLSITPTLASMLADPFLQSRYLRRIEALIELSKREMRRTEADPRFNSLARFYHDRFLLVADAFKHRYKKNLLEAFKRLHSAGAIEIIASAATHGYLPLLATSQAAVRAQIRVGIAHYRRVFGCDPRGFWLPECGYYPGLEELLKEEGIRYTFLESHGITRGHPRPRHGVYAPLYCPNGLAVLGRDPESSQQVWSSASGYPGDHDYREFYRDIGHDADLDYIRPYIHRDGIRIDTGIKYYRVTGPTQHKEPYVPEAAERKAHIHAANFLFNRAHQVEYLASVMGRKPLLIAPYDAELFGHWWYEGPLWMEKLIRAIACRQTALRLTTVSEYLEEYPVNQVSQPAASSWGFKGYHEVWLNGKTDWIYPHLHHAATRMEQFLRENRTRNGFVRRALTQALRELLLAQSSDWAFMISGQVAPYATQRTRTHLRRFNTLLDGIATAAIDRQWLAAIEQMDDIFPELDCRVFC